MAGGSRPAAKQTSCSRQNFDVAQQQHPQFDDRSMLVTFTRLSVALAIHLLSFITAYAQLPPIPAPDGSHLAWERLRIYVPDVEMIPPR